MKRFVTVALHHEVLPVWAEYRRSRSAAPDVLTLDFHTDVLSCLRRGVPAPDGAVWRDPAAVEAAVRVLRHDEHLDWALRGGLIRRAVVVAFAPCAAPPEHPGLTVRRFPGVPGLTELINSPEVFRECAARALTDRVLTAVLPEGLPEPGFILDIDCDVVPCRRALEPGAHGVFDALIRRAGLVTLSREDDWVRVLRPPGEELTGAEIARILETYGTYVASASDC